MPKKTKWKAQLGDVGPIKEFRPGVRPFGRDFVKLFRYYREVVGEPKRDVAKIVLKQLEDRYPGTVDESLGESTAIRYIEDFWDLTL